MLMRLLPGHKIEPEPKGKKPTVWTLFCCCSQTATKLEAVILKHFLSSNQTHFPVTDAKWDFAWLYLYREQHRDPSNAGGAAEQLRATASPFSPSRLPPTRLPNMPSTRPCCWAALYHAASPEDHFSTWHFGVGLAQVSYGYIAPGREEQEILLIQVSWGECSVGFLPAVPCVTWTSLLSTLLYLSCNSTSAFHWTEIARANFSASLLRACSTDLSGEGETWWCNRFCLAPRSCMPGLGSWREADVLLREPEQQARSGRKARNMDWSLCQTDALYGGPTPSLSF